MSECFDCDKFITTKKRKISDIEKMQDLEIELENLGQKKLDKKLFDLKPMKINDLRTLFLGKIFLNLDLSNVMDFIELKHDCVISVENNEFFRSGDLKLLKRTKTSIPYMSIKISLITCVVRLDIYKNMHYIIRDCTDISKATDAIEKFLFEIVNHKYKNLFLKN